uniref:Uncharacterized protein n=1 Tax=Zea mays TaxID=4577 RepID=C4J7U3_MAIZE|nr:unknown [Zea mays]
MRANNIRYQINCHISKFIPFCSTELLPPQPYQVLQHLEPVQADL